MGLGWSEEQMNEKTGGRYFRALHQAAAAAAAARLELMTVGEMISTSSAPVISQMRLPVI